MTTLAIFIFERLRERFGQGLCRRYKKCLKTWKLKILTALLDMDLIGVEYDFSLF